MPGDPPGGHSTSILELHMSWWKKIVGGAPPPEAPRTPVIAQVSLPPAEPGTIFQDQLLRKQFTIDMLRQEGIPAIDHLPVIESEAEAELPSAEQIAQRLTALAIVAVKGEGLEAEAVDAIVNERGIRDWFTPNETAFLADRAPSDHDRLQFVWRYEAAWVLYWALNFIPGRIGMPREICDVPALAATVRDTPDLTVNGVHPVGHVLTEADLIYRCHWAVRDAQINGKPIPGDLEPGVVMERHHAFNWLVQHRDTPWDDIDTST